MSAFFDESGMADALDLALTKRGSQSAVADREVADLIELARSIQESASHVRPSDEFRLRSRQRLLTHMTRSAQHQHALGPSVAERARMWAMRCAAGLGAVTLACAATASASASALPGDALYPIKQVTEAAALQLAPTDSLRQEILVHQAETRLDETARLLQQDRDADAATTAAAYEQTLANIPTGSSSQSIEPEVAKNQARLTELLKTAPGPARAGLERALTATERHTNAAVQNEAVTSEPTAPPVSYELQRPTEIPDTEPAGVRASVPADEKERGRGGAAAHAGLASPDRADLPKQADRTPVDVQPDVASAHNSDATRPPEIEESPPAPEADAHPAASAGNAPARGNARPATAQPPRSAPEHSGAAPRPAPAGRGRP